MLGNTLKIYMEKQGIKQVYVSDETGIVPQTLGKILNEQRKITTEEFFSICNAIEADPIEIAKTAGIYSQGISS
jgi:transcriptional regulator with XRE-family HTH domain